MRIPRGKLRTVVEYIEEHLDAGLTLEQMAAAAHLAPTTSPGSSRRPPGCRKRLVGVTPGQFRMPARIA